MDGVNGLVIRIEEGVKQLKAQLRSSNQELKHRESEIIELKKNLAFREEQLDNLQKEHEALKVAVAMGTAEGSSTDAKKKINELVREIDKCMALLNA